MSKEISYDHFPSSSPSTKYQFIENIIEIAKKDRATIATQAETERIVEELFYHITKFSDDDLTFGKISLISDAEIDSGEYNIYKIEIPYFNNLVRILNRLFRISRGTL